MGRPDCEGNGDEKEEEEEEEEEEDEVEEVGEDNSLLESAVNREQRITVHIIINICAARVSVGRLGRRPTYPWLPR